jgi:hypothetical protein
MKYNVEKMKSLLLPIILIFITGCENPQEIPDFLNSRIVGIVTDSDTGEALDSVEVTIYNVKVEGSNGVSYKQVGNAISDEMGQYDLVAILEKEGFHRLGAIKEGYESINYIISSDYPIDYKEFQQINLKMKKSINHQENLLLKQETAPNISAK